MIELKIDDSLITQTEYFYRNQKVQLITNRQNNDEKKIKTGIFQGSLILFNLFLKYINGVIKNVLETSSSVIILLFIDNLGFITLDGLVKKIVKILENVAKIVLKWKRLNVVI